MATKAKREAIFSQYSVSRAVAALAIPSVLTSLVNVIYNVVDTYFVGMMGDTNATAAVSITMPVFQILVAFGNVFGVGGSAYISRSMGEGKPEKVKSISSFSLFSSIFFGVILLICLLVFMGPVVKLLGAESSEVTTHATGYLTYIAIGAPFIVTSLTAGNLLRGEGAATEAMIGMMIGTVLNIILDPVMILACHMGVAGAAIATVLGNVASIIFYIIYFIRGRSILSCNPKRFKIGDGIARNVIPIGIPAALNNILMSFSNIFMNNCMKGYGEEAVAALGIAMKVNMLIVFLQMGIGMGIQPLIGYSYGANNMGRLRKTVRFTISCTVIIGIILTIIYYIFASGIINLFNGEKDPAVTEYGTTILRGIIVSGPFMGILFTFSFVFQGMGRSAQSLVLSISRQGVIFLPFLLIMNKYVGFNGIVYSQPVADGVCLILSAVLYFIMMHNINKKERAKLDENKVEQLQE